MLKPTSQQPQPQGVSNPYTSFGQQQTQSAATGAPAQGSGYEAQAIGAPSAPDAHPANAQVAAATSAGAGMGTGTTTTTTTSSGGVTTTQSHGHPHMEGFKAGAMDLGNKAKNLAGNVWGHLNTGHSLVHTAVGKLQNYRLLTPGSAQNFWRENMMPQPADTLKTFFACHLSTSTGPVAGTLFIGTMSYSFMSDRPLTYTTSPGQTAWSYYKVSVPLEKVSDVVVPPSNEKYIQVKTVDGHQFWFMGFISFDKAFQEMQEAKRVQPVAATPNNPYSTYNQGQPVQTATTGTSTSSPYVQEAPPPPQGPYQGSYASQNPQSGNQGGYNQTQGLNQGSNPGAYNQTPGLNQGSNQGQFNQGSNPGQYNQGQLNQGTNPGQYNQGAN